MAVRANQTTTANSSVEARKIDLSTSFGERWQGLLDILGISRAIEKDIKIYVEFMNFKLEKFGMKLLVVNQNQIKL